MGDNRIVVVALPTPSDFVWEVSSEKKPHLTILNLGKPDLTSEQLTHIAEFIQHAGSLFPRFGLNGESRGVLGDKDADVLFFDKKWCKDVIELRELLLQDPLIFSLYHSTEQFENWTPHITLGYPEAPAKKNTHEYSDHAYVMFDRIALWIEDSDGPTFYLKDFVYDLEVAMSQIQSPASAAFDVDEALKHYGVKGMKWGVRRSQSKLDSASGRKASEDSDRATALRTKAATGGTQALSNSELRAINERMNLEQQYHGLVGREPTAIDRGHNQVKKTLSLAKTASDVYNVINSPAGKAARKLLFGV